MVSFSCDWRGKYEAFELLLQVMKREKRDQKNISYETEKLTDTFNDVKVKTNNKTNEVKDVESKLYRDQLYVRLTSTN